MSSNRVRIYVPLEQRTVRTYSFSGRYRVRNAEGQFLGLANITGGVLKVEKLFVERN